MTNQDRALMQMVVRQTVAELREGGHICRIPCTDQQARALGHQAGMLADVGQGDPDHGVEIQRKCLEWTVDRMSYDKEYIPNHQLVSWVRRWWYNCRNVLGNMLMWGLLLITLTSFGAYFLGMDFLKLLFARIRGG